MGAPIIQKGTGSPASGDTITLDKILEWREKKERRIPKKVIPNKTTFYSEPDCAIESPKTISIITRVNSTQKSKLIEYLDEKTWHELHMGQITKNTSIDCIWIETLNFDYRRVEHSDKPWIAAIGLVCSACVSGGDEIEEIEFGCDGDELKWGYFSMESIWFGEPYHGDSDGAGGAYFEASGL